MTTRGGPARPASDPVTRARAPNPDRCPAIRSFTNGRGFSSVSPQPHATSPQLGSRIELICRAPDFDFQYTAPRVGSPRVAATRCLRDQRRPCVDDHEFDDQIRRPEFAPTVAPDVLLPVTVPAAVRVRRCAGAPAAGLERAGARDLMSHVGPIAAGCCEGARRVTSRSSLGRYGTTNVLPIRCLHRARAEFGSDWYRMAPPGPTAPL